VRHVTFPNSEVDTRALTLLAEYEEYIEYGIIFPVIIYFSSSLEKYRNYDGNHQYSKASNLP
jgi:hypothetical protein